jgi:site-specific DNA-cytosine methylase
MKSLDLFSCIGCHAIGFARAGIETKAMCEIPRAIEETKRAADARGDWDPDQLAAIPMDARSAGEFDRGRRSRIRRERIEALGDSNPPHMAEAIGRAIVEANILITGPQPR